MNRDELHAVALSYGRSVAGTMAAVYLAGNTSPRAIVAAGVAAALAPLVRYANPGDHAFGRGYEPPKKPAARKAAKRGR